MTPPHDGSCGIATPPMAIASSAAWPRWVQEVISAPLSPWQNPYVERLIGSIRRECLDHVIVLGERHLRHLLTAYLTYYHGARTHLALEKDAPTPRRIQTPTEGRVVAFPEVGGLHHRYERRAA
jgi:putative transposase